MRLCSSRWAGRRCRRWRERWLGLPFLGIDGLPKTGQSWVRSGLLAATIFVPPNAGQAIEMLVDAIQNGKVPPERVLTTAVSVPPMEVLKTRKPAARP